jgi:general secretion pathway protein D
LNRHKIAFSRVSEAFVIAKSHAWVMPVSLAVVTCVVITRPSSAQSYTAPQSYGATPGNHSWQLPTSGSQPAAQSMVPTASVAQIYAAIDQRDYAVAVQGYRSLAPQTAGNPTLQAQANQIKQRLIAIGIDEKLLSIPMQNTGTGSASNPANQGLHRMPAVAGARPVNSARPADPVAAKAEALRQVAIGRAALDRGDVSAAMAAARSAESMGVPESAFNPGEPRVWQLVLDAESAARRSGISLTSGTGPIDGDADVVQTAGLQTMGNPPGSDDAAAVAQMLFNSPQSPAAGNASPIQQVQNVQPTQIPTSYASEAFQAGLKSLSQGDRSEARKKFLEAWRYKSDLTSAERDQLQDKLTLLQPKRLVPGPKSALANSNGGELTEIQKVQMEAEAKTRRLYREVTSELANAEQTKEKAPLDSMDNLERLRRRVDSSDVDDKAKRSLIVLVDRAIKEQQSYIEANRAKIELDIQNDSVKTQMAREDAREQAIDEEVSTLTDKFNGLIRDRRYAEAEVVAKQVGELKPDSTIAKQMAHNSRMKQMLQRNQDLINQKEDGFLNTMLDIEVSAIASSNPDNPLQFSETWEETSRLRLGRGDGDSRLSEAEQEIRRKLTNKVSANFRNRPLGEVLNDLSAMSGVPIVIDDRALSSVRITPEMPVTLPLREPIKLESALNLILEQNELAHMIKNDVLMITTRQVKESDVETRTYRVTDLVTPIPNFVSGYEDGLAGALRAAYQMTQPQADVRLVPMSATDLGSNMAASMTPMSGGPQMTGGKNVLGQYHSMGSQGGFGPGGSPASGAGGGGSFADFQSLIDLIQTTVSPDTWDALGGPSTMREYPQNLSLVISTTSDVHDQITDLLESLRRLQNLQITIEVRFITLSDTFAEQIGVDFDFQVDDRNKTFPDEDGGESITVGFNGQGFTPDLDISFNNTSFAGALVPAFGGANLGEASSLGFAILSDIEAFFFIQAIQTDNRTNVMQAPKVTLFDGQIATISDFSQQPFVTSITPVVGDFAVAQQPVIVVLNEGTQLNVQGIVSDDKRFVRLTLVPFFSQIGDVDTFTFEGSSTSTRSSRDETDTNGDGVIDENDEVDSEDEVEVVSGTTVQLPTFAFTTVSTTVSVPDGGTILLGGIKRLSEGRAERGVPMLSKIPYLSRLFRNVAVGRDAQSLMLMVTPRIIIQEEEELAQTGFDPTRQ